MTLDLSWQGAHGCVTLFLNPEIRLRNVPADDASMSLTLRQGAREWEQNVSVPVIASCCLGRSGPSVLATLVCTNGPSWRNLRQDKFFRKRIRDDSIPRVNLHRDNSFAATSPCRDRLQPASAQLPYYSPRVRTRCSRILWNRHRVPVPCLVPGEDLAQWNDAAARLVEVSLLRNPLTSNDAPYSYDALERCAVLKLSLNSSSCFKLFRIRKAVLNAVVVG